MDTPNNDIPDNPEVVPISSDDATDSTTTSEGACSGVTSPSSNPVITSTSILLFLIN